MDKIRIGIVNYLNTKPLLYGIERDLPMDRAELVPDYPAEVARKLLVGQIDLALVPVAVIPRLEQAHIVSDYCIGSEGAVASVAIFSDCPLEEADTLLLDYQSRTSVALAQVLLREYWKLQPRLEQGEPGYMDRIKGRTAGVLIGDRALQMRSKSRYIYDLGEAWKDHTGLPFVFAAWVSNKPLDAEFIQAFDRANAAGLEHLDEIAAAHAVDYFDLKEYYTRYIDYRLTADKRKALALFLRKLEGNGLG